MSVLKIKCLICGKDTEIEDDEPRICDNCFKCPKCGAVPDGNDFIIEEGYCNCAICGRGWTIKAYEKAMLKKHNLKPCPHCGGKGSVPA